jgi:hypothetical protein
MRETSRSVAIELPPCERGLAPDEVDRRLGIVARAHSECEAALAFWLFEVDRRRLSLGFGFRDTVQYAAERHGRAYGTTHRLLRAARACERSPLLRDAFERGDIAISKMDVVAPMLHGDSADERWVDRAKSRSRRDLQSAVQRALGLEPDDERITLTLRFTPSQWRIFQDALERCRRIAGADLGETEAIELIAAEFLTTPVDEREYCVACPASRIAPVHESRRRARPAPK